MFREPLNLYKKQPSTRPEVNDKWMKPFAADIKTKVTFGSKYVSKYSCSPEPVDIDYDAIMRATKPRIPSVNFGSTEHTPERDRPNSMVRHASYRPPPNPDQIKRMSREEKMNLLQNLNFSNANTFAGKDHQLITPGVRKMKTS